MIEIGTLDVGGERFVIPLLQAFIPFAQRFDDGASQGLAGDLCDGLGETVGRRVFDIKAD
jgi:hypothetical protein